MTTEALLQKDFLPIELKELFGKIRKLYQSLMVYSQKGTIYQKYVICGKKGCHCSKFGDIGHGPYWYLKSKRGDEYLGKDLPEEFLQRRHDYKEVDRLIQKYAAIETTSSELRSMIKDFVLSAEAVIAYQEEES